MILHQYERDLIDHKIGALSSNQWVRIKAGTLRTLLEEANFYVKDRIEELEEKLEEADSKVEELEEELRKVNFCVVDV